MPHSIQFIDVSPKIVQVGKTAKIRVKPLFFQNSPSFITKDGSRMELSFFCGDKVLLDGEYPRPETRMVDIIPYSVVDDCIEFDFTPDREEEYTFKINTVSESEDGEQNVYHYHFKIYALNEDLFRLRPLKGDFHVHSSWSQCGNKDEDPVYILKIAMKYGLDFFALTDHAQHEPSRVLSEYATSIGAGCNVLPGEEVHSPKKVVSSFFRNNVFNSANHIVSVGAREGVCDYINSHFDEYMADLKSRMEKMPLSICEHGREMMASADYIMDKIHEFGGIVIFAHPFWRAGDRTNLPGPVREYIQTQFKYDAMEVIGLGTAAKNTSYRTSNMETVAWWQEESIKKGKLIPLVGNTDTHDAETLLGRQYTVVFAEANTTEAICDAVKDGRSVAYLAHDNEAPYGFGPRRLVKYANFLITDYFPVHDAAARAEAGLLEGLLMGTVDREDYRKFAASRFERLVNKYFYSGN